MGAWASSSSFLRAATGTSRAAGSSTPTSTWGRTSSRALSRVRATHIGQLELLAAIMVYTTVPSLVAGQFVLHFIDNTSALAGLISGSSRSWDSARLIHTFQVVNVSVRAKPWFSYVASKANVSDFPSRRDFAAMAATIRAVHKDFCTTRDFVAPVQPAVHKSWAELAAALFPLPPRKKKRRGVHAHGKAR